MGSSGPIGGIQHFAELAHSPTTVVYKGYERALDRFVLLKVLRPAYSRDAAVAQRFEDEARLLARVQHPNVVAVYAHGQDPQGLFLAAEFIDGIDLSELIERGPVPVELAVFILYEAARGLKAAHDKGVLHRDIKPANLLIAHEGQVKLADFGMASLVEPGAEAAPDEVRGTLAYLAPEQILGHPPSTVSDLFSLGATFYEMLAGRPAFVGPGPGAFFDAVLHHDPMPYLDAVPGLPGAVRAVCRRLLEKAPENRYTGVAALLKDLEEVRHGYHADAGALAAYLADPDGYRQRVSLPPEPDQVAPDQVALARGIWRRRSVQGIALVLAVLAMAVYAGGLWPGGAERTPPGAASLPGLTVEPASDPAHESTPPAESRLDPADNVLSGADALSEADAPSRRAGTTDERPAGSNEPVDGESDDLPPVVVAEPPAKGSPVEESDVPPSLLDVRGNGPAPMGTLRVVSEPWAVVYIEDDSVGVTPLGMRQPLSMKAGSYRVTLKKPDMPAFPPFSTTVEITPGRTTRLDVSLWDEVGRIMLVVSPWARVHLDGTYYDTTPLDRPLIVAPGPHVLTLEHAQLGVFRDSILVMPGRVDTLRYNLIALLNQ